MTKAIILLIFSPFSAIAGFSGHWGNHGDSSNLTIELSEEGGHISGRYCFITNRGNRIDCAEEDDINITGVISNNVATVTFMSTFGGAGKATLIVNGDKLEYSLVNDAPFIQANISVPTEVTFDRVTPW
ncbi:hypothetical protein [Siccibacter turicensis]|uniref:hypothetical protein n=1 Tax=Siccibacter turicensis TaxID=357233 RepID=UPI003F5693F7